MAYGATSFDLVRINKEIIEAVRFNFLKDILKRKDEPVRVLGLKELTKEGIDKPSLFFSEQNFIDNVLKWKSVKHFHQVNYLARQHDASVMKIRFMQLPFSFIFLITGEQQYHIVLETLDTEEATYIWNFEKDKGDFNAGLRQIDEAITSLRNHGKEHYLGTAPNNFSRIIHDYSNPQKGFLQWKSSFEQLIR